MAVIQVLPLYRRLEVLQKELHFRSPSLSVRISVSAIVGDREDLRRRLECLASDSSSIKEFDHFLRKQEALKQCLARHLLQNLSCTSQECVSSSSDVYEAGLWKKEMEPPGTWGNSNFLGAGSGASGVCRTQWLGVPCARKEFHGQGSEVTFLKEASILSHLKHPRIVNFICCGNGEAKGDRFIAMELMEKSLFDAIEDQKGVHFALPVAVDIILQIAEGMHYLHERGIAHRDLKPQNVLVNRLVCPHLPDEYYCVKLVDFGMSKTKVEVSKSDTMSFQGVGTTRYRAPEVHPNAHGGGLGKAQWFRVDVYSFAMTCAHVLTLKAPFEDMEQLSDLYASLLKGERPQLPSGLPRALVDILVDCWDAIPLDRPSFGDICNWLHVLRFKMLGGIVLRVGYPTIVRDNIAYADMRDYRTRRGCKRMDNPKITSSTGHTSYYAAEDDTLWDGDYEDFIHINRSGQRVLDHSKIGSLKAFKVGGIVTQAIHRMETDVANRKEKEALEKLHEVEAKLADNAPVAFQPSKGWLDGLRSRSLWKSKSTSFTRAPDW